MLMSYCIYTEIEIFPIRNKNTTSDQIKMYPKLYTFQATTLQISSRPPSRILVNQNERTQYSGVKQTKINTSLFNIAVRAIKAQK